MTLDRARELLDGSASVLDAAHEVGLSGGGRLHDLFVTHEAMTPGDYKRRGEGLEIAYGFHASPFGEALVMATERGVCGVAFVDEDKKQSRAEAFEDMTRRWPRASYRDDATATAAYTQRIFEPEWTTRSDVSNQGLGLAICRELTAAHGGCLSLEPRPRGACFLLRLPRSTVVDGRRGPHLRSPRPTEPTRAPKVLRSI